MRLLTCLVTHSLIGLSLLCGCSRIPEPAGFEYSSQSKMQAAHHWDVLAQDVADQINKELIKDNLLNTAVYVKTTCGKDDAPCKPNETSQFGEAFHDLLVTRLVQYGVPTSTQAEHGALTVNYKVQTVYHRANRSRTLAPGVITVLATGVEVLRNAPPQLLVIATAGAIDIANTAYVQAGHYEIIITISMVSARKYIFRTSSIYYINDEDFWQYQLSSGKAKEIRMTNSTLPSSPR
ncbi:MAG: hypothetical protein P4L42_05695 [Desulfocapsaceae bacterium]|nr:hypothetical protein [Desulfocapsaceae bacterium]